jgi:hypothetical protein
MEGAVRKRIVVTLDPGEPINGSVSTEEHGEVRFTGLMELVAAIESARTEAVAGASG